LGLKLGQIHFNLNFLMTFLQVLGVLLLLQQPLYLFDMNSSCKVKNCKWI
jgi:hypothetical protein